MEQQNGIVALLDMSSVSTCTECRKGLEEAVTSAFCPVRSGMRKIVCPFYGEPGTCEALPFV